MVEANAPRHFKELKAIEGLLESDPEMALDSVKALKEKAQKTSFTDADGNELRLREVQAQYKTRCLTEDSPDLSPVIAFYDRPTSNTFSPTPIILKAFSWPSPMTM